MFQQVSNQSLYAYYVFTSLGIVLIAGCSNRLETYPVEGVVQFKSGTKVHVGTVELKSRDHQLHARGKIEIDGTFKLTTYEPDDGAVAGIHDCVVVQMVIAEDLRRLSSKIGVVDRKHSTYAKSGLTVEIQPNKPNRIVIQVDGLLEKQPETHNH